MTRSAKRQARRAILYFDKTYDATLQAESKELQEMVLGMSLAEIAALPDVVRNNLTTTLTFARATDFLIVSDGRPSVLARFPHVARLASLLADGAFPFASASAT